MQKEKPPIREHELATEILQSVSIVSVIRVKLLRGDGTAKNPVRQVYGLYLQNGKRIGEFDPVIDNTARKVLTNQSYHRQHDK